MLAYSTQSPSQVQRLTIALDGLEGANFSGQALLSRLQQALEALPGVVSAYVSSRTEMAYIVYNPAQTNPSTLQAVIRGFGLEPGMPHLR
ncbi:MAG TPA: hypothetical protein VFS50_14600 [Meiothermus sp.]|nr:hypothetical protein [Meiothermus sp.]